MAPAATPLITVVSDGRERVALLGDGIDEVVPVTAALERLDHPDLPRVAWWAAGRDGAALLSRGWRPRRVFDLAEAHRIWRGGWRATPDVVHASASGQSAPPPVADADDLFAYAARPTIEGTVTQDDGRLRADAVAGTWGPTDAELRDWARVAADCVAKLHAQLSARQLATAYSESMAAVLAVELARDGLPIDRATAERLVEQSCGPRPKSEAEAAAYRRDRDLRVVSLVPGAEGTDLRNPASVKALLASVGIDVPTTRKHVLDAFRSTHPVIDALLEWRADERIATTYGYRWLDEHVGHDDRLRGPWTACDGAAGRMTAGNGLHNLPTSLRPAVAAEAGQVLVRADLGQIEPRVLAVVAADPGFARATQADDLYAPVAAALDVDRATAKVAVLAAMYGGRAGAAAPALTRLERAFPIAMRYLDDAYARGSRGEPVQTFGGRVVPTAFGDVSGPDPAGLAAARGRFARNAVIQGSAAELFKAWAATVRSHLGDGDPGGQIVLCLHDELLVHCRAEDGPAVAALVEQSLTESARRWAQSDAVRFVADVTTVTRWSDAKG